MVFCFRESRPLLCTLKKGWAKGARLAFLQSHIQAYKEAGLHSKNCCTAYVDQVVNKWFTQFHWISPIESNNPSSSEPSTMIAEDLLQAVAKIKGGAISHIRKVHILDNAQQYIVNLSDRQSQAGYIIIPRKQDTYQPSNHLKQSTIPSVY